MGLHRGYDMISTGHPKIDYRCDKFTKEHDGKHILFLGDSFAAGEGLEMEDTWCYKVYKKISETEKISGYFNAAATGSSISESVDQFFKYSYLYGKPDVVFFITTEIYRDERYAVKEDIENYAIRSYLHLEQACRMSGVQLYSFSWVKNFSHDIGMPSNKSTYISYKDGKMYENPIWTNQIANAVLDGMDTSSDPFTAFETFYDYNADLMVKKVFEFDIKSKTPKKSLWAEDGSHPGTSFHDFYADFIYGQYKRKNNNE